MMPALVVVGSLNMDFVVSVERLPAPGETVLGRNFQMIPGGKGANQACAAGKLMATGGTQQDVIRASTLISELDRALAENRLGLASARAAMARQRW